VSESYSGRQFVGIDLHRRRSVIVRMTTDGDPLECIRISNDAERLSTVMARAGEAPEVVLEATYGWYWAVETLQQLGAQVHLAHPLGIKGFTNRRVKNDLLTELPGRCGGREVRGRAGLVRFPRRDQRRGCAAGAVRAGGAAIRVA